MNDSINTTVADGEATNDTAVIDGAHNPADGEKTFTQEDVNRIVGERLARDRARAESELVQREQSLQQRELLLSAKEALHAKGYSPELLEALNYSSSKALEKSLAIIEKQFGNKNEKPQTGFQVTGGASGHGSMNIDPTRRAMGLQ